MGNGKKPVVPGERFPIRRGNRVIARLDVKPEEQDRVYVTVLDIGNTIVRWGPGFGNSAYANMAVEGDFLLFHSLSGHPDLIVAVTSFETPPGGEYDFDLSWA